MPNPFANYCRRIAGAGTPRVAPAIQHSGAADGGVHALRVMRGNTTVSKRLAGSAIDRASLTDFLPSTCSTERLVKRDN